MYKIHMGCTSCNSIFVVRDLIFLFEVCQPKWVEGDHGEHKDRACGAPAVFRATPLVGFCPLKLKAFCPFFIQKKSQKLSI